MWRNLLFAGLLTLQIVLGSCDEVKLVEVDEGNRIELEATPRTGKILNCTLERNGQKVYSTYPENEGPGEDIGVYESIRDVNCGYRFQKADMSHAELWTMTTITAQGASTTKFIVRVKREIRTTPANYISAYAGLWIKIGLDTNETDVRSCNVTIPGFKKYNLMTEKLEGVSLDGLCGIRMLASKAVEGQWEFYEQVGEYVVNHAMFHIALLSESAWNNETPVEEHTWTLGDKDKYVDSYTRSLFCQYTRPDGTKMPLKNGNCRLDVPVVSAFHQGRWRAYYAVEGKMELEHTDIVIHTKDPDSIECSSSVGANGEINLLCKTAVTDLHFCTFIRPDKTLIHLPAGVGNDNYSYYGNGYQDRYSPDRDYAECGVTIHKPSDVDVGLWTCSMGIIKGNGYNQKFTIRGSVINVDNTHLGRSVRETKVENPTVFVKRGDSFKINCKPTAMLSYCWLTSPNGTIYSVLAEKGSGKVLKYDGKGFAMGECGAIVPTANDTDSGEWTCHLGIKGGFELEQTVPVKVTESYLIANKETVQAGKTATLTCRIFQGEDGTVSYCRWVRPNGHGINRMDASRYKLTHEIHQCGLTILDVQSEDVGKWTCFAALTRFDDQEEWATVQVISDGSETAESSAASMLSIVLGSGLLILTLIGAFYAGFYFCRRRNAAVVTDLPPYYAENYEVPQKIHHQIVAEPLPNKDYRY